jgi:hypothetical protein
MPRRVAFSNLYAPLQVPLVLIARSKVPPVLKFFWFSRTIQVLLVL